MGTPRLSGSTALEELHVAFSGVVPSLHSVQRILTTLLSNIASPHVKLLDSRFLLVLASPATLRDIAEVPPTATWTFASVSDFHALLVRGVFDQLPPECVRITFAMRDSVAMQRETSSLRSRPTWLLHSRHDWIVES